MITNEQRLKLIHQAEQANLSQDETDALIRWASCVYWAMISLESILNGRINVSGMQNGLPLLQLTDKGVDFVLKNLPEIEGLDDDFSKGIL